MATSPFQTLEDEPSILEMYGLGPSDLLQDLSSYHEDQSLLDEFPTKQEPLSPDSALKPESPQIYTSLQPVNSFKADCKISCEEAEPPMVGLTMLQSLTQTNYSHSLFSSTLPSESFLSESLFDDQPMQVDEVDLHSWENQRPSTWTCRQVMSFVHWLANEMNFGSDFCGERFQTVTGEILKNMKPAQFDELDSKYGQNIHDIYRLLLNDEPQQHFDDLKLLTPADNSDLPQVLKLPAPYRTTSPQSDAGYASGESNKDALRNKNLAEKPKRKRRVSSQRSGPHLWEFIRNLLLDEKYNKIINWEDREQGIFRIVHSEAVAKLWGRQKSNTKMSYEKLSRALRFSREAQYFEKLPANNRFPKKLCFKFGPRAVGWQL